MSESPIPSPEQELPSAVNLLPAADDYDLVVLATIASQLLRDGNYASAVSRAFALLDECKAALKQRAQSAAKPSEVTEHTEVMPRTMSWDEFLFRVTGEHRLDRAEMKLLDAVKLRLQQGRVDRTPSKSVHLSRQPTLPEWNAYLEQSPTTTTEEARNHMARLRESGSVSGIDAGIYKWLFARYYPISKALNASERGSAPGVRGKKRGRPKKK